MQMTTASAAAAAASNDVNADDKHNESELINDGAATEATDSRTLTPVERIFQPSTDDSRKTHVTSAWSEETIQPIGSKYKSEQYKTDLIETWLIWL